jgi:hypothetical protein
MILKRNCLKEITLPEKIEARYRVGMTTFTSLERLLSQIKVTPWRDEPTSSDTPWHDVQINRIFTGTRSNNQEHFRTKVRF